MRVWTTAFAGLMFSLTATSLAHAGSLQVAPVSIEMKAHAAATSITLRNYGKAPIKAQVRVFRWVQVDGQERLEPTNDLVASPPMATVVPDKDYVVRLVRTAKQPVAAEETYRLIVDELPDPANMKAGRLNIAFRYSVPVFVSPLQAGESALTWSVEKRNGKTLLTAVNSGDRRVRVADLKVRNAKGKQVTIAKGLAGYVLARSSMSWVAPGSVQGSDTVPVLITALGDQGTINAEARTAAAR